MIVTGSLTSSGREPEGHRTKEPLTVMPMPGRSGGRFLLTRPGRTAKWNSRSSIDSMHSDDSLASPLPARSLAPGSTRSGWRVSVSSVQPLPSSS